MKTVMCAGTFDIVHPGHEFYLKEAKKQGDFLIVIVARDSTVLKIKEKNPRNNENTRVENIKKLNIADKVVLGREGNIFDIISEIKPQIICLGYDQRLDEKKLALELEKRGLKAKIIRLESYHPEIYKSSKMK